jgi:hypothetical protein
MAKKPRKKNPTEKKVHTIYAKLPRRKGRYYIGKDGKTLDTNINNAKTFTSQKEAIEFAQRNSRILSRYSLFTGTKTVKPRKK